MRIIGGEYRSRLIAMPKGIKLRPTQDKVRQAIFNILGDLSGLNVLELFAGTGALGMEALSRGAGRVTFVENNSRCAEAIRANLESLGIEPFRYDIIRTNALSVLPRLEKGQEKYDIVFSDPPYHQGMARKCLINLDSYDILSQTGLAVIEHSAKDELTLDLTNLVPEKERRYGNTIVSIFRRKRYEQA